MFKKAWTLKDRLIAMISVLILGGIILYYANVTPKNSLELYQRLMSADSFEKVEKLMLEGYEENFMEEDFKFIQAKFPNSVEQYTLLEYDDQSYIIKTSPGTVKLNILAVKQLPDDVRAFFMGILE